MISSGGECAASAVSREAAVAIIKIYSVRLYNLTVMQHLQLYAYKLTYQ